VLWWKRHGQPRAFQLEVVADPIHQEATEITFAKLKSLCCIV